MTLEDSFGFAVDLSCECFDGVFVECSTLFLEGDLLRNGKRVYFSLFGVALGPMGLEEQGREEPVLRKRRG
jgi:hypothetical protein